jgi:hypothetical protein
MFGISQLSNSLGDTFMALACPLLLCYIGRRTEAGANPARPTKGQKTEQERVGRAGVAKRQNRNIKSPAASPAYIILNSSDTADDTVMNPTQLSPP